MIDIFSIGIAILFLSFLGLIFILFGISNMRVQRYLEETMRESNIKIMEARNEQYRILYGKKKS